jgi:hypothetical protein
MYLNRRTGRDVEGLPCRIRALGPPSLSPKPQVAGGRLPVTIPDPNFPDSLSIICSDGETYTQHYFDARGVARIYKMTFEAGTWTLLRDEPDFTPLEFSQRFTATIAAGRETITGAWESAAAEGGWRKDFDLPSSGRPPKFPPGLRTTRIGLWWPGRLGRDRCLLA